ncbi:MAG: chorismate mutase [Chlamydiia bacterium]|nr:chorismate mutase [Chlamydiia bacterium]
MMTLEKLRKEIEGLNSEIIALLAKRRRLTLKIAEIKRKENLPIFDPIRESDQRKVIEEVARKSGLDPKTVFSLFDDFIAYCKQEMEHHWESSR